MSFGYNEKPALLLMHYKVNWLLHYHTLGTLALHWCACRSSKLNKEKMSWYSQNDNMCLHMYVKTRKKNKEEVLPVVRAGPLARVRTGCATPYRPRVISVTALSEILLFCV